MAVSPRQGERLTNRNPNSAAALRQLEERLGVRLIQRTTRQFAVTEVGQTFLSALQSDAD